VVRYTRFADDGWCWGAHPKARYWAPKVEHRLREELGKLDLTINEDRSRIVDCGAGRGPGRVLAPLWQIAMTSAIRSHRCEVISRVSRAFAREVAYFRGAGLPLALLLCPCGRLHETCPCRTAEGLPDEK
jgi:hypothetical protein